MKLMKVAVAAGCILFSAVVGANAQVAPPPLPVVLPVVSPPPIDATATINTGTGAPIVSRSRQNLFDRVGVLPGASLGITLGYPLIKAGRAITIDPLDGGIVTGGRRTIALASNGTMTLQYQPPSEPGTYRLILREGSQELRLEVCVLDPQNPANNPVTVNGGGN